MEEAPRICAPVQCGAVRGEAVLMGLRVTISVIGACVIGAY